MAQISLYTTHQSKSKSNTMKLRFDKRVTEKFYTLLPKYPRAWAFRLNLCAAHCICCTPANSEHLFWETKHKLCINLISPARKNISKFFKTLPVKTVNWLHPHPLRGSEPITLKTLSTRGCILGILNTRRRPCTHHKPRSWISAQQPQYHNELDKD